MKKILFSQTMEKLQGQDLELDTNCVFFRKTYTILLLAEKLRQQKQKKSADTAYQLSKNMMALTVQVSFTDIDSEWEQQTLL